MIGTTCKPYAEPATAKRHKRTVEQERIKELIIDGYGLAVFVSAIVMVLGALTLGVMSVAYVASGQLLQAITSVGVAAALIGFSIVLLQQVKLSPE